MTESIDLGARLETFVSDLLAEGRYKDRSDVFRQGLVLLEDRERKLRELDDALAVGLADVEAGRVHSGREVFAHLETRFGRPADEE